MALEYTPKKVAETRFYTGDFIDDLAAAGEASDGSTISNFTVMLTSADRGSVPSGMLSGPLRSGSKTGAWITGGGANVDYWVVHQIVLSSGAIMTHEVFLAVVP